MAAAAKLKVAGEKCGYTTGWPSWVQYETFSAWHDLRSPPSRTASLRASIPSSKIVNLLQIKHIENLVEWEQEGLLHLRRAHQRG